MPFPGIDEGERFIGSDAVKPCEEGGFFPELANVSPDFQKRVLQNVIGIVMVENDFPNMPVEPLLVF
jgi:hypothetical protein